MEQSERLFAIEQIKQLKARYFRYMDTKDWPRLAGLFTDDAVVDMRDSTSEHQEDNLFIGGEAFVAALRGFIEPLVTVHHGHTPEIVITSDDTATGIWAMEDKLWKPEGAQSNLPFTALHGYGHYHETYESVSGQWRIKSSRLTRLRVDMS